MNFCVLKAENIHQAMWEQMEMLTAGALAALKLDVVLVGTSTFSTSVFEKVKQTVD